MAKISINHACMKTPHCNCGQISYVPCLVTICVLTPQKAQKDSGSITVGALLDLTLYACVSGWF